LENYFVKDQDYLAMNKRHQTAGYHPIKKLKVIFKGLQVAVISDFSVAYKLVLSIPILVSTWIFHQWIDAAIVLMATGVMLVAELLNSAIELLCDFVEQQDNIQIGIIKDIAAAAAGISILVWGITLTLEGVRLWQLS
jgi:diacylglycerol kinase